MAEKTEAITYKSREELDGELAVAVSEILSAEAEARKIVEQAETSAKAVRLDGSTRERVLREAFERECAAYRDKLIEEAKAKADEECKRLTAEAAARGDELIESKRTAIKKRAAELLGGVRKLGE